MIAFRYIDMAVWTTLLFPVFMITYPVYIISILKDSDSMKTSFKKDYSDKNFGDWVYQATANSHSKGWYKFGNRLKILYRSSAFIGIYSKISGIQKNLSD